MKTIGMFLMGLIMFGLILAAIVTIGSVIISMIATMGEPECDKCENYNDEYEYCKYLHVHCGNKGQCNHYKRRNVWSSES